MRNKEVITREEGEKFCFSRTSGGHKISGKVVVCI